jgi:hypothetical protein
MAIPGVIVSMSNSLSYNRLYFRRPIWTPENQRLWGILFTVTMLVVSTLMLSMRWSARISPERINALIKTRYIAFLSQSTFPRKISLPAPAVVASAIAPKTTKQSGTAITSLADNGILSALDIVASQPISIAEGDALADAPGIGIITSAVEHVLGYPGINYRPLRTAKPLTLQNEITVFRSHGEQIQIPIPEVFHFASENGNRDLYETSAIMEMNEIDVKYCFERMNHFDPTFSGYLLLRFTIHPDGYVIPASIKFLKTDIKDPRVLDCIRKQLQRWRNFTPIAYEDGNFTVTRKYVF